MNAIEGQTCRKQNMPRAEFGTNSIKYVPNYVRSGIEVGSEIAGSPNCDRICNEFIVQVDLISIEFVPKPR